MQLERRRHVSSGDGSLDYWLDETKDAAPAAELIIEPVEAARYYPALELPYKTHLPSRAALGKRDEEVERGVLRQYV